MKAHIFAEGSNTTVDDRTKSAEEYFQGLFRVVSGLSMELSDSADTSLHIFSQEFGVLQGDQPIVDAVGSEQGGSADLWKNAQAELLTAAEEADVMAILLSVNAFEKTAGGIWPELVEEAKPDSIWCIGAAQSIFNSIEFGELEIKDCSVITYQRVGVAQIGSETRDDLIRTVKQKAE